MVKVDMPQRGPATRSAGIPYNVVWNQKGCVNKAAWKEISADFHEYWETLHPGLTFICVGDNLSAHRDLDVLTDGITKGVHYFFLVLNTCHWSQPLDNLMFARLKREYYVVSDEFAWNSLLIWNSVSFSPEMCSHSIDRTFSKRSIQASFKNVGLWPFCRGHHYWSCQ